LTKYYVEFTILLIEAGRKKDRERRIIPYDEREAV
jgi:hypothetical protein